MSNGTLSTQFELLSGLADNNTKAITASDVSNIVKSNFQPVMIWSGLVCRDNTSITGYNWFPRTNYYNPDFFEPRSTGTGIEDASQVWRFTNTGNLNNNTTYLNVQVTPNAWYGTRQDFVNQYPTQPAVFNLYTDGAGNVSSYDVVTCGLGWFGPAGTYSGSATLGNWTYPGQTGIVEVPNISGSNRPTVEFIGPMTPAGVGNTNTGPTWTLSTNTNNPTATIPGQGASSDHTVLNTTVQATQTRFKNNNTGTGGWWIGPWSGQTPQVGLYPNQLSAQGIESNDYFDPYTVTLWRMPF